MSTPATLQFLGASGTVTGSKYLVRARGRLVLLDCGLFQGLKALRLRNWAEPPFDPVAVDAVVLSHAHIDHAGYLPLLARRGFRGPVTPTATKSCAGSPVSRHPRVRPTSSTANPVPRHRWPKPSVRSFSGRQGQRGTGSIDLS